MRLGNISPSGNDVRDVFPKAFFRCSLGLATFTHFALTIVQLNQVSRHCISYDLESLDCVFILKYSYDFELTG